MKPSILLITVFLFQSFLTVQAQESGWEAGLNVSGGGGWLKPIYNSAKSHFSWHYGAGIYGRKLFKSGVGVELGAQYGQYTTFTKLDAYFNDMIDPINGNPEKPAIVKYNSHIRYVEIPVKFLYLKNKEKFGIGFHVGLIPAFGVNSIWKRKITGETAEAGEQRTDITKDLRTFNLFGEAALILRANITPQFSLDFKPFFRSSIFKAGKNIENYRPYTIGLSVGSVWRF